MRPQLNITMKSNKELAQANLVELGQNTYPGRIIVLGVSESGDLVQVYAIMGRSANSQNRVFGVDGERVFTEPADPAKVKNPKDLDLIIYNAMTKIGNRFVVSNGNQTDTVAEYYSRSTGNIADAISNRMYEPDSPNYTPRITGITKLGCPARSYTMQIALIKKSRHSDARIMSFFEYEKDAIDPGYGYFVSTYLGDDEPLPSFVGEPILMPIRGEIEDIAGQFWDALSPMNRVSLAVKTISADSGETKIKVINRFKKVSPP